MRELYLAAVRSLRSKSLHARCVCNASIIASMGTGYPEDFFTGLPLCEAAKLRDAVDADFFE